MAPAIIGEAYVHNAGIVLVAPYLQRLWGILELTANGSFIDDTAAQRAVHLLQYIVTGKSETPEYQLVLNKLLCGHTWRPTNCPRHRHHVTRKRSHRANVKRHYRELDSTWNDFNTGLTRNFSTATGLPRLCR